MKTGLVVSFFVACLAIAAWPNASRAAETESCAPEGNLHFICGPRSVEDMLHVPGTDWIVASGMSEGDTPGKLHLINAATKSWEVLYPSPAAKQDLDKQDYFRCPGAPDPAKFGAHGIALKQTGPKSYKLLSVNHGGRESIEVFTLDTSAGKPAITWIGCVVIPAGTSVNSVAFLPKEGFAYTKFYDTSAKNGIASVFDGHPTGGIYEWHTQMGITEVPDTGVAGANGLAVSKDGKWLYVDAWGSQKVVRFSLGDGPRKKDVVDVGFSPDNIHWAPDGKLLIAGQNGTLSPKGGIPNFKGWTVLKMDPETLATTKIATGAPDSIFQGVSNAIEVNKTLWLGIYKGDRVGYMAMP
jgi:hypothetical protein